MSGGSRGEGVSPGVSAIHELMGALSGAVTPAAVTDVFLDRARRLVGADSAAAAVRSADGESLVMLGAEGFDQPVMERWRRFDLDPPTPMGDALRSGQPVFLETADEVRARYPHLPVTGRAIAAAAARGPAGIVGAIAFRFPEARPLPEELRTLIVTIGEHFGLAFDRAQLFEAAESERQRLEALMQQLPVGVAIAEAPSGRIIAMNKRAADLWHGPAGTDATGDASSADGPSAGGGRLTGNDWPLARSLARGETVEAEEVSVQFDDGTLGWVSVSARPVTSRGRLIGAVTTLVDVTDLRRRENEAQFMADSADLLMESLDPEQTLRRLADLVVPRLADWCVVYVRQGSQVETVAVAHVEPEKVQLAWELTRRYPTDLDGDGVGRVIMTGEPELTPVVTREMVEAVAPDSDFPGLVYDELGLRSALTVPLRARGEVFGALSLVAAESGRMLDARDLTFAENFATHAALAVANARLFAAQQEIAETLQRSLLPYQLPRIPGLEIATRYRPARHGGMVGGDFFDVWQIREPGSFGAAIGDVAGKGAAAAALTALTRHTARTASLTLPDHRPADVLREVNDAILRRIGPGRFCTLATIYGKQLERGFHLAIACGGHPPPLIIRADGAVEPHGRPGTLLGVFTEISTPEHHTQINAGDILFAYTDGLTEHRHNGEFFGEHRLRAALKSHHGASPAELVTAIEREIRAFADHEPSDDIALLAIKAVAP